MPDDEFFSAEDNDLKNLSQEEFDRLWLKWFRAAQASNDRDQHVYSHGCIVVEPGYEHLIPEIEAGLL